VHLHTRDIDIVLSTVQVINLFVLNCIFDGWREPR